MSALPCPVVDSLAAANQAYATICTFLRSEEARQVKHSVTWNGSWKGWGVS